MASRGFKLEIDIGVAPCDVRDFLLDLDHLVPLHPLIESIEPLAPRPERPGARRYRVVDQIPMGPLRIRTAYTAELERIADDEVCGRAWQSPGITLLTQYRVSALQGSCPGGGATHLEEDVQVEAPFGLGRFVASQASRAHSETLVKMKQLLEGRAPVTR